MHLWDEAKLSLEQSQNTTRPGQNSAGRAAGGPVIGVKVWVQIRVEYGGGSSSEFVLCAKPLDAPLGRSQIVFGAEPKHPGQNSAGRVLVGSLGSKFGSRLGLSMVEGVQVSSFCAPNR